MGHGYFTECRGRDPGAVVERGIGKTCFSALQVNTEIDAYGHKRAPKVPARTHFPLPSALAIGINRRCALRVRLRTARATR